MLELGKSAFSEQSPHPLRGKALVSVTPPKNGYMRVHVSLSNLAAPDIAFEIDVLPATEEVGHVTFNP